MNKYFEELKERVDLAYDVASAARAKGFDPVNDVESPLALTMAERSVNLVKTLYPKLSVEKISKRILELEDEFGKLDTSVAFSIAREIASGDFGKFDSELERIDIGVRVGFAYMTLGVVSSPIEGYTGLRLGKTEKGEDYFIVNFSGPIRSAGTTTVCLILMLIDYLREAFGYAKYDPSEEEISRYVTEIRDFHEKVANLAYFPTEEEIRFLAKRLPIQIDGDPTEALEVSNFKDLARIETNRIRGGMCLAFGESLALKAGKALGRLRGVKKNLENIGTGWDWLDEYVVLHKKRESGGRDIEATYIKDLVAGRPVYGYPGRSGSFRFRYGRGRTSGFSSVCVHPATMGVSNGFLSHGTQLRLEKPSKACVISSCDLIDGPIVRLKSGSVRKLSDYDEARKLYDEIDEIVYLGDILFPIGDVIDRNADLLKPGFVSEWWEELVLNSEKYKSFSSMRNHDVFDAAFLMEEFFGKNENKKVDGVSFELAVEISKRFDVPLHPDFIFYWSQISNEEFVGLMRWLNGAVWRGEKLVLNWESEKREGFALGKRALEVLGVEHEVVLDNVVVDKDARSFLLNLGRVDMYNGEVLEFKVDIFSGHKNLRTGELDVRSVLEIVNDMCDFEIKDKAGSFIGARMGRPEKAKLRKLTGSPNVLFPVGSQGGRLSSVQEAVSSGFVKGEFLVFRCECGSSADMTLVSPNEGIFEKCEICGKKSRALNFCRRCNEVKDGKCKLHSEQGDVVSFWNRRLDIRKYFNDAVLKLGYESHEIPPTIKGVKKMSNDERVCERLEKGVLRAKFGLSVNKDGTVRYDATEIPLTHFKPREIRTNVERLKNLGYMTDIFGKELVNDDQILELKPHDVVLPSCRETKDERADDVFFNIANFVDEELKKFYGMDRFYNFESKDDLVGVEIVCMAPHNCAGVIGRVIGFSNMQGLMASPYMHAAMRRDCDGDEAAVMLLMDVLLNFSRKFLPSHRGGRQDAPLVLNARIRAGEVDDQILFFESCGKYPLRLYEAAEKGEHSSMIRNDVDLIGDVLKRGGDGFVGNGFSHDTKDFNFGNSNGAYKTLPTMKEKVAAQMELAGKLRGVDEDDVARLILERHFIRDIRGNLRKFMKQEFRCSACNEKFRRPPLTGVCTKCNGKLIFTVSEGSVRKYLEPAMELVRDYKISSYTKESMELIEDYIERIFGKGEEQATL